MGRRAGEFRMRQGGAKWLRNVVDKQIQTHTSKYKHTQGNTHTDTNNTLTRTYT